MTATGLAILSPSNEISDRLALVGGTAYTLAKHGIDRLGNHGLSGIVNIMPFSCMPGLITAGMAPRLRADLDGIPWLDIACDAQHATNIQTRLEAFLYQARQFQRRMAPATITR